MLYRLSKIIPVRMSSLYGSYHDHGCRQDVGQAPEPSSVKYTTWWQWRGRIFGERTRTFDLAAFDRA